MRIDDAKRRPGVRNLAGLNYEHRCAVLHWAGVFSCLAAIWSVAFGEYLVRVPLPPGPYLLNAYLAFAGSFLLLMYFDGYSISCYRQVWHELLRKNLAPIILEGNALSELRTELGQRTLWKLFAPPLKIGFKRQLWSLAVYYGALKHPSGTPFYIRFRDPLLFLVLAVLPLLAVVPLLVYSLQLDPQSWAEVASQRRLSGLLLILVAISCSSLGLLWVRLAARWQALKDYYANWQAELRATR